MINCTFDNNVSFVKNLFGLSDALELDILPHFLEGIAQPRLTDKTETLLNKMLTDK